LAKEGYRLFKALVIMPNEKTSEIGSILAVARSMARKRENSQDNPPIRALLFLPEVSAYVAVYEADEKTKPKQRSMG
jgi:hypothetical protein